MTFLTLESVSACGTERYSSELAGPVLTATAAGTAEDVRSPLLFQCWNSNESERAALCSQVSVDLFVCQAKNSAWH